MTSRVIHRLRVETRMDAATHMPSPAGQPDEQPGLSERDREILEFERQWWKYAGAKETAVREKFDMSATRYYQVLNALIDRPEALDADPLLVRRLRRLRAARQRAALGPPPRLRGLSMTADVPVPAARPARGGLPVAGGDPEHRRGRDGRRSPSSPPATSAPTEREVDAGRRSTPPSADDSPTPPMPTTKPQAAAKPAVDSAARSTSRSSTTPASPAWPARVAAQATQRRAGRSSAPTTGTAPSRPRRSTTRRGSRPPASCSRSTSASTGRSPAVDPMRLDRLTVILTADYA